MAKLNGVPGGGELWQVNGKDYLVYFVPGQDKKIPMFWRVRGDEQKEALFGPDQPVKYAKKTGKTIKELKGIFMGSREELVNQAEHPFRVLMDNFKREAQTRPWLRDPEVFAHVAAALLEGRTVSEADLKTTKWWRSRNEAERRWVVLRESDPSTARQLRDENIEKVRSRIFELGGRGVPQEAIEFMADNLTRGTWNATRLEQQINRLVDPHSSTVPLVRELQQIVGDGIKTTRAKEQQVRDLASRYLGPMHQLDDETVANWAGMLRNDPGGQDKIVAQLQRNFDALYSEFAGQQLTYEDVAAPWRGFVSNIWGENPDETDTVFDQVIRLNNSTEARKLLIREGLKRDNQKVTTDMLSTIGDAFGSTVSPSAA